MSQKPSPQKPKILTQRPEKGSLKITVIISSEKFTFCWPVGQKDFPII
jgi:hypothetical protein